MAVPGRPYVIALLSDFGLDDPYVGCMKGAVAKINPALSILDVCHTLPVYDTAAAAFLLGCVYKDFPERTIFICVVDPGVGSDRPILIASAGRYYFIAPDNGILTPVFEDPEFGSAYRATASHFFLQSGTQTFHGRDIMAPLAAWITKGVDVANMGDRTEEFVRLEMPRPKLIGGAILQGQVMHVDHFGNCITNISRQDVEDICAGKKFVRAVVGGREILTFCQYYAQAPAGGEPVCLYGSLGHVEIACNRASASRTLGVSAGGEVGLVFE